MKSLSFGEILWDIIEGNAKIGGAPLNVSAHLTKMGFEASIISSVGNDDYGVKALEECQKLNVNNRFIQTLKEYPTGSVDVFLTDGQPDYSIHENVAWDGILLNNALHEALDEETWEVFIFGTLAQRSDNNRMVLDEIFQRGKFTHVFFDVNLRKEYYTKVILSKSLKRCSILKLNEDEVQVISDLFLNGSSSIENCCKRLAGEFAIDSIIVTLGAKGAHLHHKGKDYFVEGKPAKVKDAIGAGDSFSAAFLYTFLKTNDPQLAVSNGCTLGAFVASNEGAIPDYNPLNLLNT